MTDAPTPPPEPPKPRRGRGRKALLAVGIAVPLLIGAVAAGGYWALTRQAGTVWLLQHLPGLQVEAPQGALLGNFSARRLSYTLPDGSDQVIVEGLSGQGISVGWSSAPGLLGLVHIEQLRADRIALAFAPSQAPAQAPPTSLALPIGLKIDALEVGRVDAAALGAQPLRELRGSLDLSAERGAVHRVRVDSLRWDRLSLSGEASVQTTGPMAVQARLALAATPTETLPELRGTLALSGPLRLLQARAEVQAKGQSLQAEAQLQPFEPWPLAGLKARAEQLDLAALMAGLPRTSLSGEAQLQAKGWSEPAQLNLQLSNAAAGRWDQQRLPVQRLTIEVQTRPDQLNSLDVKALDAQLGSSAAPGGRISGQGQIALDTLAGALTAKLSGLRPAALDARLAPLRLDGTVKLSGAKDAALVLAAQLGGDWTAGAKPTPLKLDLKAQLAGEQLTVSEARLESGAARVSLTGEATLRPAGWRADVKAQTQAFDPRLLWAGTPDSAWQRGKHSLNGTLQAQLQQPAGSKTWPQGQAQLQLQPSLLSGAPLSGTIDYRREADKGTADAQLQTQLELAGNSLSGRARLPATTPISSVDAQLELKAPQLAGLNPLIALLQPELQLSGAAQGQASVKLSRPAQLWLASTEGQLKVQTLQLTGSPKLSLSQGQLRWSADGRLDAPLSVTAELQRLSVAGQSAPQITLDLQGSWAEHRLKFAAQGQLSSSPAKGTASSTTSSPTPSSPPIAGEAQLALTGKLGTPPLQALQDGAPIDWRGRIANVMTRPSNAALPAWFTARDLGVQVLASRDSGLISGLIEPGRAELAGAAIRWTDLQWQAPRSAGERANLRAELEMEPLAVAPLLKRWQPDFGWGGQLVVGGKISVRTAPKLDVDIVLERSAGDLSVTDERGVQGLGLTDLRVALAARDGLWQFTQGLAGTNLGSLGGAVTVHADPQALWPAPGARLEGVLQANVANLSTWGGWVPPGWRLGGALTAGLQLAGTFGSPQIVGQANGSQISLRNPLEGVNITEGTFALALNGMTATLSSLSARGGSGLLTAEGQATLGDQPKAKLQLKADRFALLSRVDRRLLASGQAQLDLGPQSLQLDGKFTIDEGLFDFSRGDAPSLDDDVVVLRPDQAPAETPAPGAATAAKPSERKTRINLAVDLGQNLRIRGRGLDSRLRGELKLAQTNGAPTLNGSLKTVGGNYEAYGQKLDIERGEILFVGPFNNPRLDVLAVRPSNDDVRVGVSVTGTALNPRIKLYSEPEMSDTDKLSWLVLGRAPDGLGRADTALLQRAALALLSGEGESTSGKLIKNIGLDELSVSQADSETGDTRGTVVRLGKQLSRRWFVGYERGLNATTGSWQLIYRIAQRFTLRAQSGEDNALDLIWQWKWE